VLRKSDALQAAYGAVQNIRRETKWGEKGLFWEPDAAIKDVYSRQSARNFFLSGGRLDLPVRLVSDHQGAQI
jgi:hypothetical protein